MSLLDVLVEDNLVGHELADLIWRLINNHASDAASHLLSVCVVDDWINSVSDHFTALVWILNLLKSIDVELRQLEGSWHHHLGSWWLLLTHEHWLLSWHVALLLPLLLVLTTLALIVVIWALLTVTATATATTTRLELISLVVVLPVVVEVLLIITLELVGALARVIVELT